MTSGLKKIKKSTMAELIIDQILQMIEDGTFVPGQKLPSEKNLAEILCVSRPTLREAMRSLMSMGLIEIRCGDGTYLNDSVKLLSEHFKNTHLFNRFSINELIDTRLLLETQMAYLAAQNATEAAVGTDTATAAEGTQDTPETAQDGQQEGQTDKPPQKEPEKAAYVEREPRGRGCAWCNPDYHREQATAEGRFLLAYEPEEKLAMILDKETGAVEHMIFHCCPFCGRKLK